MDFSKIKTYPIASRKSKFKISDMILPDNDIYFQNEEIEKLALQIKNAKVNKRPVILMIGGAVIKDGCSLLLIDLVRNGFVNHIANEWFSFYSRF